MARRKTHEEFVAEVEALVGNEYTIVGTYTKSSVSLAILHHCGHLYKVRPSCFLTGRRCPKCAGNQHKTHDKFVAEVEAHVGDEYTVSEKYINSFTKIKIKHSKCGNEYKVVPNSFLQGSRCIKCSGKMKKNTLTFTEEVKSIIGDEYEVLGVYIRSSAKIKIKHSKCGNEYKVVPNSFLQGSRCPICAGNIKKSTETFRGEVKNLAGSEYEVLGKYINSSTKIKMKHTPCGSEYKVVPHSFLQGSRCPICNESKGEREISNYLRIRAIENFREFKFQSCRDKRMLPFDFAIKSGDMIVGLIEYDGELHYKEVTHFGGEPALIEVQRRDAIKTKFCTDNGIPLIRIPYWDFDNIDAILTEKLLPLLKDADKHNAS